MTPIRELPPRRPGRSPPRVRKITNHGDKPPFATPVPVGVAAATPIYLTQMEPPKPDLWDNLQVVACIVFLAIVTFALVGPSAMAEASNLFPAYMPSPPAFVPLQQRGPFHWAWLLVKSTNDW